MRNRCKRFISMIVMCCLLVAIGTPAMIGRAETGGEITLQDIQQRLDILAQREGPYLVMEEEDIAGHINAIMQREFVFDGEPSRNHIDDEYLETIRNSYFGPIYSYFTGLDKEKETQEFWEFYYDRKANRATVSSAKNYKGSDMREIWRWLIGYHFVENFGYSSQSDREDLYEYTTKLTEILYHADGHSSTVPSGLESIMGKDLTDYSRHNYHAEVIGVLFYYALVFPDDEKSAEYFKYAYDEFVSLMQEGVYDGGAWNESQRYAGAILRTWVPLFHDIKRLMGYDLFQNEEFKEMLNFFVETQTPSHLSWETEGGQTKYFVGRTPGIGDEIWTTDWFMFLAMAAPAYRECDPVLAGKLMYAWKQAGSPYISNRVKEAFTISILDPDIAPIAPDFVSKVVSQEKGIALMQYDRNGDDEKWLIFRSGADAATSMPLSQHQHSDKNSLSLFAYGYPLILDPGISEYDEGDTKFLRSTPAHSTVDYAKYLAPELLYKTLYGEEQMQFTNTTGSISEFQSTQNYDRLQGMVQKSGWDGTKEKGPFPFKRDIIFVKPSYFIVKDRIDEDSEADLIYNGLCAGEVEISGNEAVFHHPSGNVNLKIVVLNHGGVVLSTDMIPLADGTPWGSNLQSLKITSKYPEKDGFVTILYPYRDGDPDLTAVYNNETEQIQVICGDRTDLIDMNGNGIVLNSSVTNNFNARKLYAEAVVCGGPHGDFFDDYNYLYQKYTAQENMNPSKLHVYAGSRVDAIAMEYPGQQMVKHGGDGGTHYEIEIPEGIYITKIVAYNGKKDNQTRVFGLKAIFSDGTESPVYGSVTKDVTVLGDTAENGQIVGIYGRSGNELDRLGVIILK